MTCIPILHGDDNGLTAAVDALAVGQLVGLPTETVYGLAALAGDDMAVSRVFAAKGRPQFNPLIVHVTDVAQALTLAQLGGQALGQALALADAFWPGPLTLVVPKTAGADVSQLATAGLDSIALRAPAHPLVRKVIAQAGPLVMPSANPSGRLSPTSAHAVVQGFCDPHQAKDLVEDLGQAGPWDIALVINGGLCAHGVESTVIGLTGDAPTLLRAGPIDGRDICAVLDLPALAVPDDRPDAPQSPGRTLAHYAPARARLRLNADAPGRDEAYLGFGLGLSFTLNLSLCGDVVEAAANLFRHLKALDDAGFRKIAIAPIPSHGLGAAINDRLARAANADK